MSRAKLNGSPRRSRTSSGRNGHNARPGSGLRMSAMGFGGYDAAGFSTTRGYVYFPTLDSAKDLDSYTLYELRRKSRWLYVNSGFARRIINGIAGMIGSLTPVPLTGDKEWNALVLKKFTNDMGAELVYDVSGKFNFWSAQPMKSRCRMIDGDILTVLTESQDSKMARFMFYEAHQIANASDDSVPGDQNQWVNGVRSTPQNRILQFRILNADGNRAQDISAADAFLHAEFQRPARQRGEPVLCHAINHLLDRAEVLGFLKQAGKNASQIGYQIVRQSGFTGPIMPALGAGPTTQTISGPNGATTDVQVEQAYKGGKIVGLAPGEEIKLLLDQRPHPNQMEFLEYLGRDIAAGTDMSTDLLWNIAKLGGANMRYVLAEAQKTIEQKQTTLADQVCSREYIYYVAKELKAGRLRPCQDPEWWQHGWQPEQKLTVDIRGDGKLFIDMHKSGMITLKRYHSGLGQNWQVETNEYLDERQFIIQSVMDRKITLPDGTTRPMTMEEAFPPEPGAINVTERANVAGLPGDHPDDTTTPASATPTTSNA